MTRFLVRWYYASRGRGCVAKQFRREPAGVEGQPVAEVVGREVGGEHGDFLGPDRI